MRRIYLKCVISIWIIFFATTIRARKRKSRKCRRSRRSRRKICTNALTPKKKYILKLRKRICHGMIQLWFCIKYYNGKAYSCYICGTQLNLAESSEVPTLSAFEKKNVFRWWNNKKILRLLLFWLLIIVRHCFSIWFVSIDFRCYEQSL